MKTINEDFSINNQINSYNNKKFHHLNSDNNKKFQLTVTSISSFFYYKCERKIYLDGKNVKVIHINNYYLYLF